MPKSITKSKYLPKMVGLGLNTFGLIAPRKAAEIALDIFCSPRKGRIESYQKKFLKKFDQVELSYDGRRIMTYNDGRTGPRVLLCHGWESNSFRWRKLYRQVKEAGVNIIMMDAPAHGNTEGDKFNALLYSESINVVAAHYKPSIIIGHSVGGYASIIYTSTYKPDFLSQLIVMASPDRLEDITQRYFGMIGLGNRVGRRYYRLIKERFGREVTDYNAADYASTIHVDGLIIHDRDDDINLYFEAESIHAKWPKSTLVTTQGLGHSLQHAEVYQTIQDRILSIG